MRTIVDILDSFTGIVRLVVGAMVLCVFLVGFMITAGASHLAPKVADNFSESATQLGERAIAEARNAQIDRELAKDGWGYGSAGDASRGYESGKSRDDANDGWADEAR